MRAIPFVILTMLAQLCWVGLTVAQPLESTHHLLASGQTLAEVTTIAVLVDPVAALLRQSVDTEEIKAEVQQRLRASGLVVKMTTDRDGSGDIVPVLHITLAAFMSSNAGNANCGSTFVVTDVMLDQPLTLDSGDAVIATTWRDRVDTLITGGERYPSLKLIVDRQVSKFIDAYDKARQTAK